jgi:Hypervirulence associated proteins TUDOR domain
MPKTAGLNRAGSKPTGSKPAKSNTAKSNTAKSQSVNSKVSSKPKSTAKKPNKKLKDASETPILKKGDQVEWETSQGKTRGTVKKKVASSMKVKGYKVKASENDPQVLVESDKTGQQAVHKPSALKKVKGEKSK